MRLAAGSLCSSQIPSLPVMQVLYNIHGKPEWDACFVVDDIDLPTGYYVGITAVTGDLAGTVRTP